MGVSLISGLVNREYFILSPLEIHFYPSQFLCSSIYLYIHVDRCIHELFINIAWLSVITVAYVCINVCWLQHFERFDDCLCALFYCQCICGGNPIVNPYEVHWNFCSQNLFLFADVSVDSLCHLASFVNTCFNQWNNLVIIVNCKFSLPTPCFCFSTLYL